MIHHTQIKQCTPDWVLRGFLGIGTASQVTCFHYGEDVFLVLSVNEGLPCISLAMLYRDKNRDEHTVREYCMQRDGDFDSLCDELGEPWEDVDLEVLVEALIGYLPD